MKILLFMMKGVEMLEASAFLDVFGWHKDLTQGAIVVETCGFNKEIVSSFNLTFKVNQLIENIKVEDYEALLIPGGFGYYGFYEEAYHQELLDLIKKFDDANKIIASICVGAFPIAKAGVLKDRRGTTYNQMEGRRQNQIKEMGVKIVNEPIVIDKNIITSWGPSTAPEVAFKVLEMLTSLDEAEKVKTMMGY